MISEPFFPVSIFETQLFRLMKECTLYSVPNTFHTVELVSMNKMVVGLDVTSTLNKVSF